MKAKKIDDYFGAKKALHEYFGYVSNWVEIPMEEYTDEFWGIVGSDIEGEVWFCKKEETIKTLDASDIYSHQIYTQRFLPKWVYRGEDYTMICVDTRTDGNKFLAIFDNEKERDTSNLQNY